MAGVLYSVCRTPGAGRPGHRRSRPRAITLALAGVLASASVTAAHAAEDAAAVVGHYADIAHAAYGDSLTLARELEQAVEALIAEPGPATLAQARQAWTAARVPYMQTEVYRFGNAIVDEWEGKVNAWPLDEGLIDYVDASYGDGAADNPVYAANVIARERLEIGGEVIDVSNITPALLADRLHELAGVEANVATGYHAIEFLLWGQDLHGTGPGAGERPWTDYSTAQCTHGHCARRAQYLAAVTRLLVDDLAWMTDQWAPGGAARTNLTQGGTDQALASILQGLGSLSYGELAGERMQLGLMLHDPEEEHDCFSDQTHLSHYHDVVGMLNVYTGTYTSPDGNRLVGPALSHLVAARAPQLDLEMQARLAATESSMWELVRRARHGEAYDQMIASGNSEGNAVVQAAIDALTAQTATIEKIVPAMELEPIAFEGSDSLDDPEAVFQ